MKDKDATSRMPAQRKTALITGGSSGNGKALAHQFAMHGYDLILVSQNESRLHAAEDELRKSHPDVSVSSIVKDLTQDKGPQEVYEQTEGKGIAIDVLVNDAGVGQIGEFEEIALEKHLYMIRLNVEALTRMSQLFLPAMLKRKSGKILNLGSVAGFQPSPRFAVYAATKAYVNSLSAAMAEEVRGSGVQVSCLCPGPIETPFISKADMQDTFVIKNRIDIMQPEQMAEIAFREFMAGKLTIVPGTANTFLVFMLRFMSRRFQARLNRKVYADV